MYISVDTILKLTQIGRNKSNKCILRHILQHNVQTAKITFFGGRSW